MVSPRPGVLAKRRRTPEGNFAMEMGDGQWHRARGIRRAAMTERTAGAGPAVLRPAAHRNSSAINRPVASSLRTTRSPFRSTTMLDEVVRQSASTIGVASGAEKY